MIDLGTIKRGVIIVNLILFIIIVLQVAEKLK